MPRERSMRVALRRWLDSAPLRRVAYETRRGYQTAAREAVVWTRRVHPEVAEVDEVPVRYLEVDKASATIAAVRRKHGPNVAERMRSVLDRARAFDEVG
jgi:hypothetical protein